MTKAEAPAATGATNSNQIADTGTDHSANGANGKGPAIMSVGEYQALIGGEATEDEAAENPYPPGTKFRPDDTGNAERFTAQHGRNVRFDHTRKHYYCWTGTHWAQDVDGEVQRLAKATVRSIFIEAAALAAKAKTGKDPEADALWKWARSSAAESRRNAMLNLARSERPIAITHDQFDRHDLLLNVQNGTLDLETGELRPHDRADLLTYVLPVAYDPAAECPTWDSFLWRAMGGDAGMIDYLARAVGYTLSGSTREQCFFFCYGDGANGKTTQMETLLSLMGDLGHKARAQILMSDERGQVPNEIAALAGKRLVVASELTDGGRLNEGRIKDLTGGDTMSARFLYGEPFMFRPTCTLWLYGNHRPVITGTDDGIWRRVRLIPFTVQIPENERDPDLSAKLRAELAGILAWAVRGWLDYRANGLGTPTAVTEATAEYRSDSDLLGQFLDERCIQKIGAMARSDELWEAYRAWAAENGLRPLSSVRLARQLKERGLTKSRDAKGYFWEGIGILTA